MSAPRKAVLAAVPRPIRAPARRGRRVADPCRSGLDLLRSQALFLQAQREDAGLAELAPDFGIDPEFWGSGCAARAVRNALGAPARDSIRRRR